VDSIRKAVRIYPRPGSLVVSVFSRAAREQFQTKATVVSEVVVLGTITDHVTLKPGPVTFARLFIEFI
jgi:hypothetical protein